MNCADKNQGDTHGVCTRGSDASHDGDDDVLFNGERPRVEREAKNGNIWEITSPGFANGKSQHLGDNLFAARFKLASRGGGDTE